MSNPLPLVASPRATKYRTKSISPLKISFPRTRLAQQGLPQWPPKTIRSLIIIRCHSSSRFNIKFKISNLIKAAKLMKEFKFNNSRMWRETWHNIIIITWCKVNNRWEATKLHICHRVLPTFILRSITSISCLPLVSQTQSSSRSSSKRSINKLSNIVKSCGSDRLFSIMEDSRNSNSISSNSSSFTSRTRFNTTLPRASSISSSCSNSSSTSSNSNSNKDYSNQGIRLSPRPQPAAIRYSIKYWLQSMHLSLLILRIKMLRLSLIAAASFRFLPIRRWNK